MLGRHEAISGTTWDTVKRGSHERIALSQDCPSIREGVGQVVAGSQRTPQRGRSIGNYDGRTMHLAPLSTSAVSAVSPEEVALGVVVVVVLIPVIAFVLICEKAGEEECVPEQP